MRSKIFCKGQLEGSGAVSVWGRGDSMTSVRGHLCSLILFPVLYPQVQPSSLTSACWHICALCLELSPQAPCPRPAQLQPVLLITTQTRLIPGRPSRHNTAAKGLPHVPPCRVQYVPIKALMTTLCQLNCMPPLDCKF